MIELVRRAAIVVLWIWIAIGVIVGELARPAPARSLALRRAAWNGVLFGESARGLWRFACRWYSHD